MAAKPFTSPVEDSVPKVDDEVAVGEDLRFQRRWWVFERLIWMVFTAVLVLDLCGAFGQGWLAQAERATPDRALTLRYERIERASTPSTMTLKFSPAAAKDGHIQVYLSRSVFEELGAQRIAPQPAVSALGGEGITYTFPVTRGPSEVQIQLQPAQVGPHRLRVQAAGEPPLDAGVFVMP